MVCSIDKHEVLKRDDAWWNALPLLGYQTTPEDDLGPEETLEYRNCPYCNSTLARILTTKRRK